MYVETENKQVVAHLYRGEMNRLTVYRQRLDITTNWAITLISGILVIYINRNIDLYFVFFPLIILFFFSLLEARRYRYFFTSAKRVQLLEIGYFGKQIFSECTSGNELNELTINLITVNYLITLKDAWIIRFYRNYIWLSYMCLLIMTYKYLTIEFRSVAHLIFLIILYGIYVSLHILLYIFQNHDVDM
jgi:uncharacterized membrane protein